MKNIQDFYDRARAVQRIKLFDRFYKYKGYKFAKTKKSVAKTKKSVAKKKKTSRKA